MRTSLVAALVQGVPDWVWVAIGAGLLLLVVLAILLATRKAQRASEAAETDPSLGWDESMAPLPEPAVAGGPPADEVAPWPEPVPDPSGAAPPATADVGEVHYCRCPACQTQFTVTGPKPIVTNCPGCGKKGYLR